MWEGATMIVFQVTRSRLALSSASLAILLAAAPPAAAAVTYDVDAAQDYCVSVGGQVQERQATWNTNSDPEQWVDLGRTLEVCRFEADDEAGSRIYVDLLTLWSEAPSLAAAAYLAKVPMSDESPPGNPATYYCADLGGSAQWGTGAAGGGWVNLEDPDDPVLALCVFPDGSAIDEWGIAYYSGGAVRGADLAPLFRADTSAFPPIFAGGMATEASTGDLNTAAAEAPVSAAAGGVVEVTNADGTLTTIAFPAGSVSEDMTVVVTPLNVPTTDKGAPLTPGVLVEQKGNEGQHLQLASPAIVTFAIKGQVPEQAAIVTFTDPETAQPLTSSISKQGKKSMVTAFVSSFSETTVDGDPGEWGDLAPLTPDHRWSLTVSDSDSRTVQKVEMSLTAEGKLKSTALTGKFAFSGMSGPLDLGLTASLDEGPIAGSLDSTKISGEAKLDDCWVQVANMKKGTFWVRGNGNLFVSGSATLTAQAKVGDTTSTKDFTGDSTSAVKIGVKASSVPAEVGGSVPATFTIYDGGYAWEYRSTLTWVSK
jgi:putative hemolysin